jgi:type VI protein secretion system component Hcp
MHRIAAALFGIGLLACAPAHAAIDVFLCVPEPTPAVQQIPGESLDTNFRGCNDVLSFSTTGFVEGTGAEPRDLRFTKYLDSGSGPLIKAMVNGTVLTSSTFHFRKSGGAAAPQTFYTVRLVDSLVTSVAQSVSTGEDRATESVSLRPEQIEYSYRKSNPDGSLGTAVITCWNVAAGISGNGTCK